VRDWRSGLEGGRTASWRRDREQGTRRGLGPAP
jgi:hypothetical protein